MRSDIIKDKKEISGRHSRNEIKDHYLSVRNFSRHLVEPLEIEDFVIQVMAKTSPTKWHLAHVSWFFETFVLDKFLDDYNSMHPQYAYFFNSYYLQTGVPFSRAQRGVLSRPTVKEVFEFRKYVDEQMLSFFESCTEEDWKEAAKVLEIGINHEQQHQELILTDLKYMLAQNPLMPVYRESRSAGSSAPEPINWINFSEGMTEIGNSGNEFTYDNEHPVHKTFVQNFELADRLVTNAEYLEFMQDGGYERSELWLDEGWSAVKENEWKSPLYWYLKNDQWHIFTLSGSGMLDPNEPVTHVSYYEADAYARWMDSRLPTEQEWEHACADLPIEGNFVENEHYHPVAHKIPGKGLKQMYGDVWEWTMSSYAPYPGYKPLAGALGEYNGKFMANQYVLRGGSCATSQTHIRKTYRNFFHADARWQFNGIRLAR